MACNSMLAFKIFALGPMPPVAPLVAAEIYILIPSNIMKTQFSRYIGTLMAAAFLGCAASAGTFTKSSGDSFEGEISKLLDGTVHFSNGGDGVEVALADLDASSKAQVEAWASENPQSVDVYTKWDSQPRVKSTAMPQLPEQFCVPEFKGMVSVDLVLNENGQVIHAAIKKSTHEDLEAPSLEAAKTWIFEPAQIGGKPVKSKLRVPFKFTYTPPTEEVPAG